LAFWNSNIIPNDQRLLVMGAQIVAKILIEVLFTPLVYWAVNFLKKAEKIDYYDYKTNFNPFKVSLT
jgi:uncharacterized PurR-regulated membrane protein YhhQ (DUF165 family)